MNERHEQGLTDGLTGRAAKGFAFGWALGWLHEQDPKGFWRWVKWAYFIAAALWIVGAFTPSLPTSDRILQGACAVPAVLYLLWRLLVGRPSAK